MNAHSLLVLEAITSDVLLTKTLLTQFVTQDVLIYSFSEAENLENEYSWNYILMLKYEQSMSEIA